MDISQQIISQFESILNDPIKKEELENDINGWCKVHGLLMGDGSTAPVCVTPYIVQRKFYEKALQLGPIFNKLVHLVSLDRDFINRSLKNVNDEFTSKLKELFELIKNPTQSLVIGIHRSDYMIHENEILQQVEINTISSGFLGLSTQVPKFQKYILDNYAGDSILKKLKELDYPLLHNPIEHVADVFDLALDKYCNLRNISRDNVVVMMVVQENERNSVDQWWIQTHLWESRQIKTIRRTLGYVAKHGKIEESKNNSLFVDGYEIGITYFRAAYTPNDYHSSKEWEGRTLIEKSFSIKCPNIAYHLVGTKKIQQVFAEDNILEKYLNEEELKLVKSSFTELYGFENNNEEIKQLVYDNPDSYVMKPQREGGGNLLYGSEMIDKLKNGKDLNDYILMKRIKPKESKTVAYVSRKETDKLYIENIILEMGCYGFILADNETIYKNEAGGYLLRSKGVHVEDGGVASGRALLDSPLLVD